MWQRLFQYLRGWPAWLTGGCLAAAPFPVSVPPVPEPVHTVRYQIVTNEIKAKQTQGPDVEVYRFDPGVFVVHEGDQVELAIRGLKGHDHPVVLEGYGVRGVIHRNQMTTLRFRATRPGVFRLICTAHADAAHEGPMEGYLIVLPKRPA
ncbi:MAG: transcriptional regulator [Alicyclobacillaceae bacterium]|nr:transcriptional regulator [Alicyclobacillaceae bacterium]